MIDRLSNKLGVRLTGLRFHSRNTLTKLYGEDIILLCPKTFMNMSGKAIKSCADFYNIKIEKILIIHDDLDLPAGRVKVAGQGGAGGHKGVQSVIDCLGNRFFPRVKIGIGRPRRDEIIEDYVLSSPYDDEKDLIEKAIKKSVEACLKFISEGVESTMNIINNRNELNGVNE